MARDLLHLFLIGDDAVGRLQDRLEFWMQIIGALVAELSRAIGRNVRHRPRPVERDQHDQVFEAVGTHVDQRAAHALTFHLEDADRLAARQRLVGLPVIERNA
jgi:DNA-binding GntR family transcriptional regulator